MNSKDTSKNQHDKEIPILALVVPCFNEEEIITSSSSVFSKYIANLVNKKVIHKSSFICFVDDGSIDRTLSKLLELKNLYPETKILKLSKNFGHQAALLAGLTYCSNKSDYVITMDADLQDDIDTVEQMVIKAQMGSEIVYGVRNDRETDSFFKKNTAKAFYNFMRKMGASTIKNHADFRLLNSRAINYLLEFKEVNLFLRGLIPEIGLQTDKVYYKRKLREAGETKYPLRKMIGFAIEGITSFSVKPLRMVTALGLLIILISLFVGIYILLSISSKSTVPGWASQIISIWFLGGIQLFAIGILGEYIGKIYKETKGRPRFHIEKIY